MILISFFAVAALLLTVHFNPEGKAVVSWKDAAAGYVNDARYVHLGVFVSSALCLALASASYFPLLAIPAGVGFSFSLVLKSMALLYGQCVFDKVITWCILFCSLCAAVISGWLCVAVWLVGVGVRFALCVPLGLSIPKTWMVCVEDGVLLGFWAMQLLLALS